MSTEEKCPNCGAELGAVALRCDHCEITFVRCGGCGRLQPVWVSICAYCNSPVHGSISVDSVGKRAIEVDDGPARAERPTGGRPKKQTLFERLSRLDTQAREKIKAGKSRMKPPRRETPFPAPEDKADPSITTKRAHHVTHDFDPQVAQEELQEEERKRMKRWRATERLNPNWFYRQSAVPTMLILLGLAWGYGELRYSARSFADPSILDFISHILIGIGLLWMVALVAIDHIRLVK